MSIRFLHTYLLKFILLNPELKWYLIQNLGVKDKAKKNVSCIFSLARQLSCLVPANPEFLCDKAAVMGDTIKGTLSIYRRKESEASFSVTRSGGLMSHSLVEADS
jgi:hypothetical protein